MSSEFVALGDNVSEIKVVGRATGEIRPIGVPDGVTQRTFYRVVGAFDAVFRAKGAKPTVEDVVRYTPGLTTKLVKEVIATPQFVEAMRLRGVGFVQEDGLSPQQSATLNILEDFSDTRKLSAKLKAVGVTRTQFNGWLKDPVFRTLYEQRIEDHLKDAHLAALSTIMTNAESGDQKAAEKVLEITGRYNPQNVELQHARAVVTSMVEAIQRHVKDEEVIKAIVSDVEMAQQVARLTQ